MEFETITSIERVRAEDKEQMKEIIIMRDHSGPLLLTHRDAVDAFIALIAFKRAWFRAKRSMPSRVMT